MYLPKNSCSVTLISALLIIATNREEFVSIRRRRVKLIMAHTLLEFLGVVKSKVDPNYCVPSWKDPKFISTSDKGNRQK